MFNSFSHALNELLSFQEAIEAANRSDYFNVSTAGRGSYPAINLYKKDDDIALTAEIPGVKKEDIQLEIKGNLIRISGKSEPTYPENASVHRLERRAVHFDRTIQLPITVDDGKVSAQYEDGILTVFLPRVEEEKPKQIVIN